VDVPKSLYESLTDPAQRHDLGEYYTPDWLAAKIVAHALTNPLEQRVLDPACGSGTFLFHVIRLKLAAAEAAGFTRAAAVAASNRRAAWTYTLWQ
jgi:type I restriction-modification system DNA methylase subunit